jgi:DNA-directed RNA polymerase specialized sigma subunit
LIEISVVSTPANKNSLFTLSKSIKAFFDDLEKDLKNNNTDMEIKEIIEAKVDEALEIKEEITEEVILDEVEIAGETPETTIINQETEVKSVEIEEKVDDQAELKAEIKSLKDMVEAQKNELEAQKSLMDTVLDNVLELSKKTFEVK